MGCGSTKIMNELYEIELSYGEYSEIKNIAVSYCLTDEDLIERIHNLKNRGIRLTTNNVHLWKTYLIWIKEEPTFKSYSKFKN